MSQIKILYQIQFELNENENKHFKIYRTQLKQNWGNFAVFSAYVTNRKEEKSQISNKLLPYGKKRKNRKISVNKKHNIKPKHGSNLSVIKVNVNRPNSPVRRLSHVLFVIDTLKI